MKDSLIFILILVGVIVLYILYRKNFKILNVPSVCLITGGVKTGKSLLSVKLSMKDFKKRHLIWRIKRLFDKDVEEPLYYTNVFVTFGDYRWMTRKKKKTHRLDKCIRYITLEHFLRNYRFNYKSVIYIQECSLLADNMDYNNAPRNVDLSLFNKLIAHETRGGTLYYDTQSVLDSHYSIKRVCSTYLFIQKKVNFLGLFLILYVREMINQENGVNSFDDDVDTTTRKVLVPRWWFFRYNRYEFSFLTDDLDKNNVYYDENTRQLISFNPLYMSRANKSKKGEKKL